MRRLGPGALACLAAAALCLVPACRGAETGAAWHRPDLAAERRELLRLHEEQRRAHFERRADLLVATFADDFVSLEDGHVRRPAREESRERLQAYFDEATFLEWDDVEPPVVRISDDATLAHVIVHKRVRLTHGDAASEPREERTVFAWIATYEKRDGRWLLTAVASTDDGGGQ